MEIEIKFAPDPTGENKLAFVLFLLDMVAEHGDNVKKEDVENLKELLMYKHPSDINPA